MSLPTSGPAQAQMVTGLAALVCHDGAQEVSAENLTAIIKASGNEVPSYYPTLYASYIEKAGGVQEFFTKPSAGGAAAPAAAGAAAPAAAAPAKVKEEEVDPMEGGMSMFGGGDGGDY
jgi:large subunit ribosomal protein LP1